MTNFVPSFMLNKQELKPQPTVVIPKKTIFKVQYGYGTNQFLLVNNIDDLCRAIYAKTEKIPLTIGGKFISGQEIKEIVPDIHSYTGWYRSYEPTQADDFLQIERDVPLILNDILQLAAKRVEKNIVTGNENLIGKENLSPQLLLESSITPHPTRGSIELLR